MGALILDGIALSKELGPQIRARSAALPRPPGIAVVRVGHDPASEVYVRKKGERAQRMGFVQRAIHLADTVSQSELMGLVDSLNADEEIDGILVQLPLPPGLDPTPILDRIDPAKDVDGFHAVNAGLLSQGRPRLVPCTPLGVIRLLEHAGIALNGLEAVVVGRSNIVGRPMGMLLEQRNATVTLCHSRTRDLAGHIKRADLVVAALGRPGFVQGEWVRDGAVLIDVGINRLADGRLVGDIDFEAALPRARAITPVPGGVGPMTITMLMENTLTASTLRQG